MKGFLAKIQLVFVAIALAIALFVTPGGFFDGVLPLGIAAWALWLLGIAAGLRAFPASSAGRVAVIGAMVLVVLLAISTLSSPDKPAATGNLNLALSYLGWLLAAGSAFSEETHSRWAEPMVWATTLLAASWGLSERIAPREVHFSHSRIAFGRLLEPIGYWNAMGALAGIGLVIAVALSASGERPASLRAAAAATSPLLMASLWLSFSRGALAATACGLAALCVSNQNWKTVRIALGAGLLTACTAFLCEALPGVRTVTGNLGTRSSDGLVLLGGMALLAAVATVGQWANSRAAQGHIRSISRPLLKVGLIGAIVLGLLPTAIVLTGSRDSGSPPAASGADANRLKSLESNRSQYWSVAMDEFARSPITGTGSGSFRAAWQRSPHGGMTALNAHSLEIETLAELGLLGLLSLLAIVGGIWTAGTRRRAVLPQALAGASAALAVWLAHSAIDWDWQVPGLMFPVVTLAAAVAYAPRKGFDSVKERGLKGLALVIGLTAFTWTAHMWESNQLRVEGQRMTDAAMVLGWTPKRERYVINRLEEASWLNPSPLPRADLAAALFDMGRPKAAATEAIELAKDNPDWWFGWALVWKYRSGTSLAVAAEARAKSFSLRGLNIPARSTRQ